MALEFLGRGSYNSPFPKGSPMILGMSTATFTQFHVVLSLIGIAAGFVVVYGMMTGKRLEKWTALFLFTTALTSLTGFAFPNDHLTPGIKIGILSMVALAIAIVALYVLHLAGPWRWIYVVTAVVALYFNFFVLIVQFFEKIPALHALVPTQKPPFPIAQLPALILFIVLGIFSVKRFRPV